MASLNVGNLGEYLREQRRAAQLSLRQLADAAGVSNPYLSQIERGLRKPSADVLQQVAKALRISAETLYVRAGILDEREREELETRAVILADPSINERQKNVLLQIYDSFRRENGFVPETDETDETGGTDEADGRRPVDGRPGADGRSGTDDAVGADATLKADARKDDNPHS
ncbi:helix-turn-helix domain-containing protein [Streptomyces bacillaris]|uniref:Helix-turn-helix domain-containing protein n=1 Tax=Streptomyces cavourensis TaxID=67258 RepID=A0AAD0Q5Z9_9ACTN|nr:MULTISPECIES: helix-turn-helix transcriptional regulator [Streptomyces]NUW23953.1 helix-turn-helix transcriptional regulator [Streptomyces roseoviolaceus]AXI73021.1 XRE family transcriptional regulator [Streptomyces cavourensis]NUV84485.1 helix-turn-helix transcriptional regulator [Streptomyces sp. CAI-155]NUV89939.1 helix-turn-helix transcriptional regulator [Streptomyces sp. KAI-26]UTR77328.1 helix-turn-helix domain-containing protein [Streptomyces cavourensis]